MCGFCGVLRLGATPLDLSPRLLDRMTDTMEHRGPDDRGTWRSEDIALGHRRLSVIDLSRAGRQPMANEDESVLVVYNGEVYNFRELSHAFDLKGKGHRFRSRTDTEVLLHLFEELGVDMARHLNGMFALGIWDGRERALYLIRDRYGIKPLFYQRDERHLRFASEIKAILADPRVPRRPSIQALHDYLTVDYVPGPQTAFQDIFELPPAHWMRIGADGATTIQRYWDLPRGPEGGHTEAQVVARSLELMEEAVQRRLIADVPIGVLLSGGLDSSALVALMSRHATEPIRTFAVGFQEKSFDERGAAATVARHFRTRHSEVVVTPDRVRELLPGYLRYIDEPYADGSAIPTWWVSRLAKGGNVVVLLSGEGGDEAFAGYETYAAFKAARMARRVPGWIRNRVLAPLVNLLPVSHGKLSFEFRAKRFLGGLDLPPVEAHLWWRIVLTDRQKRALYTPAVLEAPALSPPERHYRDVFERSPGDTLNRLLHTDAAVFLPDDLMIKNDRMTMAHSLEARVPFTDPNLTEFLASVPGHVKMPGFKKKHVMRRALKGLLPEEILNRRKVGLELPYSRWLTRELKPLVLNYFDPERVEATGLFLPQALTKLVDEHLALRADHGRALWGLLNYMMWHEMYVE